MYPYNRSEASLVSSLNSLLRKLRTWIRQEIVDDDPWDTETLFSDSPEDVRESPAKDAQVPPTDVEARQFPPEQFPRN